MLITLEKICTALGVTLSQFFQEGNSENLTEEQKEVLKIWNNLSTNEQETVMFFLCTVERYSIIKPVFLHKFKSLKRMIGKPDENLGRKATGPVKWQPVA